MQLARQQRYEKKRLGLFIQCGKKDICAGRVRFPTQLVMMCVDVCVSAADKTR
jgi:hypothetical protein